MTENCSKHSDSAVLQQHTNAIIMFKIVNA